MTPNNTKLPAIKQNTETSTKNKTIKIHNNKQNHQSQKHKKTEGNKSEKTK